MVLEVALEALQYGQFGSSNTQACRCAHDRERIQYWLAPRNRDALPRIEMPGLYEVRFGSDLNYSDLDGNFPISG